MYGFLIEPLARLLATTVQDPAPVIASAVRGIGEPVIWSGSLLSGEALVKGMGTAVGMTLLALVLLASCAFVALRRLFDPGRKTGIGHGVMTGGLVGTLFFAAASAFFAFTAYGIKSREGATALILTRERAILIVKGERTDIPATALTGVMRNKGGTAVRLKFVGHAEIVVDTRGADLAVLHDAVDRLAVEAGSKTPIRRDSLG